MSLSPPRPKDLPLNGLRAFEAAARLQSFAAAGQELGVSAGAISAHIKSLEDIIGAPLFQRTAKGVALNGLGQRVQPGFAAAFDLLGDAVRDLRQEAAPNLVHIATLPSIAQLWLSRRLPQLRAEAPDISVTALEHPPNLKRSPYDLCLFFAEDGGQVVAEDWIFPVCAPALAGRLSGPEDIRGVPCISDTTWAEDWRLWAATACPGQDIAPYGPDYSLYALGVEEAVNGAGAMIGHLPLVQHLLDSGALTEPFGQRARTGQDLRLWARGALTPGSAARRTADWLRGSG